MRLLLDTHILMWSVAGSHRLPRGGRGLIEDVDNEKLFSAASIWEVGIKFALGRPDFTLDPTPLLSAARREFIELQITSDTSIRAAALPAHHRDPFDRMLVAQAIDADAVLVTVDAQLAPYAPHILMVA